VGAWRGGRVGVVGLGADMMTGEGAGGAWIGGSGTGGGAGCCVVGDTQEETCASRCSISCSCCRAFTNAVFRRFVCSAFSAFLTFVVTHCSHMTLGSLPETKHSVQCKCSIRRKDMLGKLPPWGKQNAYRIGVETFLQTPTSWTKKEMELYEDDFRETGQKWLTIRTGNWILVLPPENYSIPRHYRCEVTLTAWMNHDVPNCKLHFAITSHVIRRNE